MTGKNVGPEPTEPPGTLASSAGLPISAGAQSVPAIAAQQRILPTGRDPPTPGRKEGHLLGWPSFLLAHTAHLHAHTKDSFSNQLPRFELFNKAFCFDLVFFSFKLHSCTDPAVAKIKDFSPRFLPQLSFSSD